MLNLNVTPNLVANVERARAAGSEAPRLFESMGHGDYAVARYRVANFAGVPVVYRLAPAIASDGIRRAWTVAAPGVEQSLDVPRLLALTEHIDMVQCVAATRDALLWRPRRAERGAGRALGRVGFVRVDRSTPEEKLMWFPCAVRCSMRSSSRAHKVGGGAAAAAAAARLNGSAQAEQGAAAQGAAAQEDDGAQGAASARPDAARDAAPALCTAVEVEVDADRFAWPWSARPWWASVASVVGRERALTSLDLAGTGMGDRECAALAASLRAEAHCAVTAIDLSRNALTDAACWHLSRALQTNRNVVTVNVDANPEVDAARLALSASASVAAGGAKTMRGGSQALSPTFGAPPAARSGGGDAAMRRSKSASQLTLTPRRAHALDGGAEECLSRFAAWPLVGAAAATDEVAARSAPSGWQALQDALAENREKSRYATAATRVSAMAPSARCASLRFVCAAPSAEHSDAPAARAGSAEVLLPLPELEQWLGDGVLFNALPTHRISAAFTKVGVQEHARSARGPTALFGAAHGVGGTPVAGGAGAREQAARPGTTLVTDVHLEGNAKVLLLRSPIALRNSTPLDLVLRLEYAQRDGSAATTLRALASGARAFVPIDVAQRLTGVSLCEHIGLTVAGGAGGATAALMGNYVRSAGIVDGRASEFYCRVETGDELTTLALLAEARARGRGGAPCRAPPGAESRAGRVMHRTCIVRERRNVTTATPKGALHWCIRRAAVAFAVDAATGALVPTLRTRAPDIVRPVRGADAEFVCEARAAPGGGGGVGDLAAHCEASSWWVGTEVSFSRFYRYSLRDLCSQFDLPPLTYLTI